MLCPECGKPTGDTAKFCQHCGTPLAGAGGGDAISIPALADAKAAGGGQDDNPGVVARAAFEPPPIANEANEVFRLLLYPWSPPMLLPPPLAASFQSPFQTILRNYAARVTKKSLLKQVLEGKDGHYYLAPDIPAVQLQNAQSSMHIPPSEPVLALYDQGWFHAKWNGVAFGQDSIYWNTFCDAPLRIDYCQLMGCEISLYCFPNGVGACIGKPNPGFQGLVFLMNADKQSFYDLLLEIQRILRQTCGWDVKGNAK